MPNQWVKFTVVFIFFTLLQCKSGQSLELKGQNQAQLSDNRNLLTYEPYSSFSAEFSLSGTIEGKRQEYNGKLLSKPGFLSLILKDTVFDSPLVSLTVKDQRVFHKNHAYNKITRLPLAEFKWVEVLGTAVPFSFFLPVLQGYPPAEYTNGLMKKVSLDSYEYINEKNNFIVTLKVKEDLVSEMSYFLLGDKASLKVSILGNCNPKGRYFPKTLVLQKSLQKERLQLKFKKCKSKL